MQFPSAKEMTDKRQAVNRTQSKHSLERILTRISHHVQQEAGRGLPQTSYKLPEFLENSTCVELERFLYTHGYRTKVVAHKAEAHQGLFFAGRTYIHIFWE